MYIIADANKTPTCVMDTATSQRYSAEGKVNEEDRQTSLGNRGDMSEKCSERTQTFPSSFLIFDSGGLKWLF